MMQALNVNPVDSVSLVKPLTNIVLLNQEIEPAKKPINNVKELELSNLTSKKDNSINRFLEAYGDCV
ncbi:MAG: hypothetical protein H7Z20_08980 [Bdellovibrio sp.]|nr:hypothetical protein [Methylotenera sp.]